MRNEDKAAFANALRHAAHQLDAVSIRTDLNLPYDVAAGLISAAYDLRQGALALTHAPGAADVYLDGAARGLAALADSDENLDHQADVARALESLARTQQALHAAPEESPGGSDGR
jgi:hypothetical protein